MEVGCDRQPNCARSADENADAITAVQRATTDADGRFVCCFLDLPGMSFRGRFKQAKLQTPEFTLATGEGEQTFVLQ